MALAGDTKQFLIWQKSMGSSLILLKNFPRLSKKNPSGLKKLENSIVGGKPVMVSLHYKLSKKNGGHVVVVNGVRKNGKIILGYHIQDPDKNFQGNNYYLSKDKFLIGWRGGVLYFSK